MAAVQNNYFFHEYYNAVSRIYNSVTSKVNNLFFNIIEKIVCFVSDKRARELSILTATIGELERVGEQAADSALEDTLIGLNMPFSQADSVVIAPKDAQKQLLAALKTERYTVRKLLWGMQTEDKERVGHLAAEYLRSSDVYRYQVNPGQRKAVEMLLPLAATTAAAEQKCPIETIPAYMFYFPHALDSDEVNNWANFGNGDVYNPNDPWATTLEYVEKDLLTVPFPFLVTKDVIATLYKKLGGQDGRRHDEIVVYMPGMRGSFDNFAEWATDKDHAKSFSEMSKMSRRWDAFESLSKVFQPQHWNALSSVCYLPPPPAEVESRLDAFCKALDDHLQNPALHPYQVAAFIHFGITQIHPYIDKNGRIARLFMNIYLMQQGFMPLIVLEDGKYTEVSMTAPDQYEKTFIAYLEASTKEIEERLKSDRLPKVKNPQEFRQTGIPGCPIQ